MEVSTNTTDTTTQGSVLKGILGAFLGGLLGAVLWVLIGMLGYISGWVAFLITSFATKGYERLGGRRGLAQTITVVIVTLLCIVLGCVSVYGVTIVQEYNDLSDLNTFEQTMFYKTYPNVTSFAEAVLTDEEVQQSILKDLGVGLLFSLFGLIPLMTGGIRKKQQQLESFQPVEDTDEASLDPDDEHWDDKTDGEIQNQ